MDQWIIATVKISKSLPEISFKVEIDREMSISIIIPTHNRKRLLEQTINSIRQGDMESVEIIIVDDGSTDGTRAYLESLPEIRWFEQKNSGPAIARNLGAEKSRGAYLAFLDSDDVWFPWTAATYKEVIEHTRAAFIAGKPFRFHDEQELRDPGAEALEFIQFKDYLESGDKWRWYGCSSFVIERNAFFSSGGFVNKWINAEDADMALRLGTAKGFVEITSPFTFGYRQHSGSEKGISQRTVMGIEHLMQSFRDGRYPGSVKRRKELQRILSRHLRPAALDFLNKNQALLAWRIYLFTLAWHVKRGRWKFLAGFPLRALKAFFG